MIEGLGTRLGNSNSLVNNYVVLQASAYRVVAVRTTGRTPNSVMTEPSDLAISLILTTLEIRPKNLTSITRLFLSVFRCVGAEHESSLTISSKCLS